MRGFALFAALSVLAITWLAVAFAAVWIGWAQASDGFVGMLERRFQVVPGAIKVVPECNCSIRYVGTSVHGRRYTVVIERLD